VNKDIEISTGSLASTSGWYKDIIFYLKCGQFPISMSSEETRALKMKAIQYVLAVDILFQRNFDEMILRCVDLIRTHKVLEEF